ncbi:WD40 repeat domain-containing protein [Streptomyces sp. WA6-1-16]|uniref:WD40 repeat domain-containing protein n=1 Tax=Streptomyces sp. WA6-1-16 TaxID=2879427 RepID=UPI001CE2CBB3|nr:WD40 repeat domain-containing protein [Streptomyces sp. WA6-1-16]UCA52075.1 WD40 repeat domain-containing protein [Streptomyces sp. WA6-1-16]
MTAAAAALPAGPNPYIEHHLAGHVAEADAWEDLASAPEVLDHLAPRAVAAEALRVGYGRVGLPDAITATLVSGDLLASVDPGDRATVRAITTARFSGSLPVHEFQQHGDGAAWTVRWARLRRALLPAILTQGSSPVGALRALSMPDGRGLLAVGTRDGRVRLWDPQLVMEGGQPLFGTLSFSDPIHMLDALTTPDGDVLLAVGAGKEVHLWDPVARSAVGATTLLDPQTHAVKMVGLPGGRALLAASFNRHVRLWDPFTGQSAGPLLTGPKPTTVARASVEGAERLDGALEVVTLPDGRVLLAAGGSNYMVDGFGASEPGYEQGRLWVWDITTGEPVWDIATGYGGSVRTLVTVPLSGGRPALATVGGGGVVRLFDAQDGMQVGEWLHGNGADVVDAWTVPVKRGRSALVTVGSDHSLRAWDHITGTPIGAPMAARTSGVSALTGIRLADGRAFVAGGSEDGTVQIWDTESTANSDDPLAGPVDHLAAIPLLQGSIRQGRPLLVSVGSDETLRLWESSSGLPMARPVKGCSGRPLSVPMKSGKTLVALGGGEHPVRLWDPESYRFVSKIRNWDLLHLLRIAEHPRAVALVPLPGGRTVLVMQGSSALSLWDPAAAGYVSRGMRRLEVGLGRRPLGVGSLTHPAGRALLYTGSRSGVVFRDPETGAGVAKWTRELGRRTTLTTVSWSNGRSLLAVMTDHATHLVDPFTEPNRRLHTVLPVGVLPQGSGPDRPVSPSLGPTPIVAWVTREGREVVATGGPEGSLRLWASDTGTLIHVLPVGTPINALLAMGSVLIIGSRDGLLALESGPGATAGSSPSTI